MSDAPAPRTPGGWPGGGASSPSRASVDDSAAEAFAPPPHPLRLLVLAPGSRGDVQPLLAVCRLLLRDGHSVRFACHDVFRESVEALNDERRLDSDERSGASASCWTPSCTSSASMPAYAARLPSRGVVRFCRVHGAPLAGQRTGVVAPGAESEEVWRLQLADYLAAASSAPVDALLFNWFGVAAVHLAEALRVPALALWPGAPFTRTRAFACPLLPAAASAPVLGEGDDANLRGLALYEALLWRAVEAPLNAWRQDVLGLEPLHDGMGHWAAMARAKTPVLYGFSPRALSPPPDWPARVITTGPWMLPAPRAWEPPPRLHEFLLRAGPVLYCGFGSAALRDGVSVAAACVAGARQAGCRVLMAGGLGGGLPRPRDAVCDGERMMDVEQDADVFWMQDAPHDWLLPRVDAVLHHGGAGTCHAAMRAGTPQVLCPLEFDQPFWARRLRALGVAPDSLAIDALSADAVAAAVRRALSEPIRSRAAAMADELASEDDGAEVAAAFISAYVPAALQKRRQSAVAMQPASHVAV